MKTILNIALLLMLSISLNAADFQEFSYGDNINDIRKSLESEGKIVTDGKDYIMTDDIPIAGMSAEIDFNYDLTDSTLTGVTIYLKNRKSLAWKILTNALTDKYGNPEGKSVEEMYWIFDNGNRILITRDGYVEDCNINIIYVSKRRIDDITKEMEEMNNKNSEDL